MADANQAARELAEVMERVNYEMARYGQLSVQTQNDLTDAQMRAKYGVTNFTKAVQQGADALAGLTKGATDTFASMTSGTKGAKAANAGIDAMAGAAQGASKVLASLFSWIPGVKALSAVFNLLVGAAGAVTKEANQMSDTLYQTYSNLAQTGSAATDGMTGVFRGAKKLGLSMEEIGSYATLLGENSKDLSLFAGTVFEGRKQFENMGAALEPYRKGFMQLGYTQQELNDASMQYLRLQTRIGRSQTMTTDQLAQGAAKYLAEQDALTKLTGMSRKEQEQALEAARSQTRFRAKLEEMRMSGDEQQIKAAAQLETEYVMLYRTSKRAAQGFGDLTTGMIDSEAAVELYQTSQGKALEVAEKMKASQMDAMQGFKDIGMAVGQTTKDFNMLHQMDAAGGFLLDIKEATELGIAAQRDIPKLYKAAQDEVAAQMGRATDGNTKKMDGLTAAYSDLILAQQKANKAQEENIFKLTTSATQLATQFAIASGKIAEAISPLVDAFDKLLQKLKNMLEWFNNIEQSSIWKFFFGDKARRELTPEEIKTQAEVEKTKAAKDKAFEGATVTQLMGFGRTEEQKKAVEAHEAALKARYEAEAAAEEKRAAEATAASTGGTTKGSQPLPPGVKPSAAGAGRGMVVPPPPGARTTEGTGPTADTVEMLADRGRKHLDDIFSFGRRGPDSTKQRFEALEDKLEERAIAAAELYWSETGKGIQLNSAVRSREEQAKLFAETDPTTYDPRTGLALHKKTGMPVLDPNRGGSHQEGTALDIQNTSLNSFDSVAQAAFAKFLRQPLGGNDAVHWSLRDGGIAHGPKSGYQATLHGQEAVIPLKNGAVPVKLLDEAFKINQIQSIVDVLLVRSKAIFGSQPTPPRPEVEVKLDLAQIQEYLKMEKLVQAIKGLQPPETDQYTAEAVSKFSTDANKMFAQLRDFKLEPMTREVDQELLDNAVKMFQPKETPRTDRMVPAEDELLDRRTVMIDALRQNAASSGELVSLLGELLRAQRDQNDISSRLLQVASN